MARQSWFTAYHTPTPRVRLFCFPAAGRGAAAYTRTWPPRFPGSVEVLPAKLPGREGRFGDKPVTRMPELVEQLAANVEPLLDVPFALFGHSLGALVAFELARFLRDRGKPLPLLLMVAARAAPHLRTTVPLWHLPRDRFLDAIQERYGAFSKEIKDCPELLDFFEPVLRADFTLFDNYHHRTQPPLECPIRAYGGTGDTSTSLAHLKEWEQHTTAGFSSRTFDGGHFFLDDDAPLGELAADIASRLCVPVGIAL